MINDKKFDKSMKKIEELKKIEKKYRKTKSRNILFLILALIGILVTLFGYRNDIEKAFFVGIVEAKDFKLNKINNLYCHILQIKNLKNKKAKNIYLPISSRSEIKTIGTISRDGEIGDIRHYKDHNKPNELLIYIEDMSGLAVLEIEVIDNSEEKISVLKEKGIIKKGHFHL